MSGQPPTFALRSRRVVFPDGVRPATVVVSDGTIADVLPHDTATAGPTVDDVGDLAISPGVVDAHVHVNEPGHTDWEGFETATRAAAAGGVTTIVDMPLNSLPVTTTPTALAEKRAAATGKCWVDVGFYGGLVPGNAGEMPALCAAGVLGVKAFLCHSGLDEFPNAAEADLREAMPLLALEGVPLLAHAELLTSIAPPMTDVRSHAQLVASRPAVWELDAIALLIRLCRESRCPVHIVHLATGDALPMLAEAKREGLPITVETCPHYLFFGDASVAEGDTRFKCAPPIRPGAWLELWRGLQAGTIDTVGSDHSPCPPEMKKLDTGDFAKAWGGIASLQLTLSTMWTFASQRGEIDLANLAQWLSLAPAKLVGLGDRKGRIAPGYDADFVVWNPDEVWKIESRQLFHRHKPTPYDGYDVRGQVRRTYVRGGLVFRDGVHLGRPAGALLRRSRRLQPATNSALKGAATHAIKPVSVAIADHINALDAVAAEQALSKCCASPAWVRGMLARRPFPSNATLNEQAEEIWQSLDRDQWLAAFAAHPKIGDIESLKAKYANTTTWASSEQAGVAQASDAALRELSEGNREYEGRFGYIFIVCATGKSADEMLALLNARLPNDPIDELRVAAAEQLKITMIRLGKLGT